MAEVISEYPERLPNGDVRIVQRLDDGTYRVARTESWAQNQGLAAPSIAPSGGQIYNTREGPMDYDTLKRRLISAGYNGDSGWDPSTLVNKFNNAPTAGRVTTAREQLAQLLGVSVPESNQMNLDWAKEQYGKTFTEDQRQYEKSLYAGMAKSLLETAARLHGQPANWPVYAQNVSGGQNVFNRLLGSEPAPRFGAPTATSQPMTMAQLLADLGLGPQPSAPQATTAPQSTALQAATAPLTGGQQAGNAQVPLPHQINPAVWDSLPETAKQVILGSVMAGNTPSGGWDPNDWLAQLNSRRPGGVAPSKVAYNFAKPSSFF